MGIATLTKPIVVMGFSELAEAELEDILSFLILGDGDRWGNWTLENWKEHCERVVVPPTASELISTWGTGLHS